MPIACLSVAVLFGLICATLWLISGGAILSALWVYIISGQVAAGFILCRTAFFKSRSLRDYQTS